MQGFFVSATGSGTLTFDDADRTHSGANNFYKSDNPDLLILQAEGENFTDETWIHFNEESDVEHDGIFDAYKRISTSNTELPQIFSITPSGTYLSVNGLPETASISLGFTALVPGTFTITATKLMESTGTVLEDLQTNEFTDLLQSTHTFNYNAGDDPGRFVVHFSPLAVDENPLLQTEIYSFSKDVYVAVPEATKGEITVYGITGQKIATAAIKGTLNKVRLQKPGFYIVKVQSNQGLATKKVFIK
jgi:hypothetical protein